MTQSEWVEYIGSDEQILEMEEAEYGFVCRFKHGDPDLRWDVGIQHYVKNINLSGLSHYLICKPHPLANMIIRQAQTGQPVWIKVIPGTSTHLLERCTKTYYYDSKATFYVTTAPDWNIPGAEYSFTKFES